MPAAPRIELLWFEGCPSWPDALRELEAAVSETGLDPRAIVVREVDSWEGAALERFPGSPTIRIDGRDLLPEAANEQPSLSCRVYRLRDGRLSPTPDPADLREALERAVAAAA